MIPADVSQQEQNAIDFLQQKEVVVSRRKTRVLNAIEMKNLIRKGATAIYIRD